MQLRISYKDGHTHVCNLTSLFFETDFVFNKYTKKNEPVTAGDKAMSLAYTYGAEPHHVVLFAGNDFGIAMERHLPHNRPERVRSKRPLDADERYTRRQLRRLFKGTPIGMEIPEADQYIPAPLELA